MALAQKNCQLQRTYDCDGTDSDKHEVTVDLNATASLDPAYNDPSLLAFHSRLPGTVSRVREEATRLGLELRFLDAGEMRRGVEDRGEEHAESGGDFLAALGRSDEILDRVLGGFPLEARARDAEEVEQDEEEDGGSLLSALADAAD